MTFCHFFDKKQQKKAFTQCNIKFIWLYPVFYCYSIGGKVLVQLFPTGKEVLMLDNFQFNGFVPNQSIKRQSRFFYNLIEKRAPSDSKKTASLTKRGKLYEARLRISSAGACSFEIFSRENSISGSMNSLRKQFFDKIIRWNKQRDQKVAL